MRLDYPLELINSKLPKKWSSYYQRCLIGLFAGNIGCVFVLIITEASEAIISLVFGGIGTLMFIVFFVLCLAKLYNDESDGRDLISVYMPALTALPIFNSIYGWLKRFSSFFVLVASYGDYINCVSGLCEY